MGCGLAGTAVGLRACGHRSGLTGLRAAGLRRLRTYGLAGAGVAILAIVGHARDRNFFDPSKAEAIYVAMISE